MNSVRFELPPNRNVVFLVWRSDARRGVMQFVTYDKEGAESLCGDLEELYRRRALRAIACPRSFDGYRVQLEALGVRLYLSQVVSDLQNSHHEDRIWWTRWAARRYAYHLNRALNPAPNMLWDRSEARVTTLGKNLHALEGNGWRFEGKIVNSEIVLRTVRRRKAHVGIWLSRDGYEVRPLNKGRRGNELIELSARLPDRHRLLVAVKTAAPAAAHFRRVRPPRTNRYLRALASDG